MDKWVVVQQDMNTDKRTAKLYHWNSKHMQDFAMEPHDAAVDDPAQG